MHGDNVPAKQGISAANDIGRHHYAIQTMSLFDRPYHSWLKLVNAAIPNRSQQQAPAFLVPYLRFDRTVLRWVNANGFV